MSIWYQHNITAFGDRKAIGKFFNLDPETDIHYIDRFDFSFGQRNVPGLRLAKLIEQNPDLIFLINQTTDYDTHWYVQRILNSKIQSIVIERYPYAREHGGEINKLLLQEYTKKFPTLPTKHFAMETGYEEFRWEMFFSDFNDLAERLNKAEDYKEMESAPYCDGDADPEFDKAELVGY